MVVSDEVFLMMKMMTPYFNFYEFLAVVVVVIIICVVVMMMLRPRGGVGDWSRSAGAAAVAMATDDGLLTGDGEGDG